MACLQEVQKSWDELTQGAALASGAYGAPLIAALSKQLCEVLKQPDSPFLATAKMQVHMRPCMRRMHAGGTLQPLYRSVQAAADSRSLPHRCLMCRL